MKAKKSQHIVQKRLMGHVECPFGFGRVVEAYDMADAIVKAGPNEHFYYVNGTIIAGHDDFLMCVAGSNSTHTIDTYKMRNG